MLLAGALPLMAATMVVRPQLVQPHQTRASITHLSMEVSDAPAKPAWLVAPKKLTDDGREYAEDAWIEYGGSGLWLENLRSTINSRVLERISASDANSDYHFWDAVLPSNLDGKWEGPPDDPFSTSEEEAALTLCEMQTSKRSLEDGTSPIRKLCKTGDAPGDNSP